MPSGGITVLSCGSSHGVAVIDKEIYSWGQGEDGQLGHGDASERRTPCKVAAMVDKPVTLAACGAEHTITYCEETKECFSWGWGDFGRLGHGDYVDAFLPRKMLVLDGIDILSLACGDTHCHAITSAGVLYSWGRNQNGQLGLGHREDVTKPVRVEALDGVKIGIVACGAEHSVACTRDGEMFSWGWNCYGNLGLGDKVERQSPQKLDPITQPDSDKVDKVKTVACGWRHSAAITESGRLFTFGWSKYGQLGHGDNEERLVPYELSSLGKVKIIQAGWRHTVAIDSLGKLYAWGWNRFGQLGIGTTEDQNKPCMVKGEIENLSVANTCCGWRHTLALVDTSLLYAFGRGVNGQLGSGNNVDVHVPSRVLFDTEQKQTPPTGNGTQQNYIAASERYAVVPLVAQNDDEGQVPVVSAALHDCFDAEVDAEKPEQKRAKVDT